MKTYTLKKEQFIDRPLKEVFAFFEKPENLECITPKSLQFRILTPKPIKMESGARIDYVIKILGIPQKWTTLIEDYSPPHSFVDTQAKGPYALWHHTHTFEEKDGGTLIRDEVKYAIPLGIIGQLAHVLFVKRQLEHIFEYRKEIIEKIFDEKKKEVRKMKIIVAGGSGFIGKSLLRSLVNLNHEVTLLTRNVEKAKVGLPNEINYVTWDGSSLGDWKNVVDGSDAVINLAGAGIADKRWSKERKQEILDSRVNATRAIVHAIEGSAKKPSVLINASAIGYYGSVVEGEVSEERGEGSGFLATTCALWEKEAKRMNAPEVRLVLFRIGVVLEKGGGALAKMLPPFQFFAGGPLGSGKQGFSWVHRDDILGAIHFILENENVSGPVNATAPTPATMKSFCKSLGKVMHRPSFAPVPGFALRLLVGEMANEMLLEGQQVVPKKLQDAGYEFKHPELEGALRSILKR